MWIKDVCSNYINLNYVRRIYAKQECKDYNIYCKLYNIYVEFNDGKIFLIDFIEDQEETQKYMDDLAELMNKGKNVCTEI